MDISQYQEAVEWKVEQIGPFAYSFPLLILSKLQMSFNFNSRKINVVLWTFFMLSVHHLERREWKKKTPCEIWAIEMSFKVRSN